MSINKLNENIKLSKYNDIFISKTLSDKYISFCKIDKGKYYATLNLIQLLRINTSEAILNESIDSYEQLIDKIIYEQKSKDIVLLLNNNEFSELEKKILSIIIVYNNLIIDNDYKYNYIKMLQQVDSKKRTHEQLLLFCNTIELSIKSYYYMKTKVLKKAYNMVIKSNA